MIEVKKSDVHGRGVFATLELYLKEKNCGIRMVVGGLVKMILFQRWASKKLLHITVGVYVV